MTALRMAMAYQCAMLYALEQDVDDDDENSAWQRRFKRCLAARDLLLKLDLHLDVPLEGKL